MKALLLCGIVVGSLLSFKLYAANQDLDAAELSIHLKVTSDNEDTRLFLANSVREALKDLDAKTVDGEGDAELSIISVRLNDTEGQPAGYAVSLTGDRMISINEMAKGMRFETEGVLLAELTERRVFRSGPRFHTLEVVGNDPGKLREQITKSIGDFNDQVLEGVRSAKSILKEGAK